MRKSVSWLLLASQLALADIPLKTVELEWEPVEGASGYEVRLVPRGDGKHLIFPSQEASLVQQVPVGVYRLRVRSKSAETGDFSPWSDPVTLEVTGKETMPIKPADKEVIEAGSVKKQTVQFEWAPVENVADYTVKVWSESRKDKPWTFTTKATRKTLEMPPGEDYQWQVYFNSGNEITYVQEPKIFTFTLLGSKLIKPAIETKVDLQDLKALKWSSPHAKEYAAKLYRRHLDESEWTELKDQKGPESQMEFARLKPGAYKLEVTAHSARRQKSDTATFEFVVKPRYSELLQALKSP